MSTTPVATSAPAASAPSSSPTPSAAPSAAPATKSAAPSTGSAPSNGAPQAPKGTQEARTEAAANGSTAAPEATTAQQAATEAAKEAARKLKLKVNGKEMELDESEVVRRAQLASAADERFREAAEMRKSAEQFFQTLINDPKSVLLHPELRDKINFRALAEEYLGSELKRELMSPEERELHEVREWRKQQEEQQQRTQQEQMTKAQQEEMTRLQQRAAQEYDRKISDVLAESNLPKNAYTVKRVAELLHGALTKGYDLDVQTAVDMVREGYMSDVQALVGGLDGEALLKLLGDDITKKLRKHDLARIKAQLEQSANVDAVVPQASDAIVPQARRKPDENRQLRPDEWREEIRRKAGL
jgi:hypothetical protein